MDRIDARGSSGKSSQGFGHNNEVMVSDLDHEFDMQNSKN